MAEDCYIIGIDFGTTYSGVAWCWSGQPDITQVVTRWKTQLNLNSDNAKTPTEIYYGAGDGSIAWGYDVPPDQEPIRWFKLLLVSDKDLSQDLRNSKQINRARQLVQGLGKNERDVIADYLRLLWKHVTDDIVRDRGEAAFRGSRLKVWITIPAIWQRDARQRMRLAAQQAGILDYRPAGETTLDFVAEPEAAAMAVLDDFQGRPDVNVGDVFVVCDAGGGTVDIISYSILNTKPLVVQECVEGQGKMCGAIFVDAAFENMLQATLGDKWKRMSATSKKTLMNNEWEFGIKRSYDDSNREWNVTVPLDAFQQSRWRPNNFDDRRSQVPLKSGQLKFGQGHIRTFFGTVLPHIRGLIHNQVGAVRAKCNKPPKAILLVGGLGSCNYLYQELQREFSQKNIMVLQPSGSRPWTAICRGAVIRGLSDSEIQSRKSSMIVSRVSRTNYGTSFNAKFDAKMHDERDKYWDQQELCFKARTQMEWYLKRGEDVHSKDPVRFDFYRLFPMTPFKIPDGNFKIAIYENPEQRPPSRMTEEVNPLVTIMVRVEVPFESLPTYENSQGMVFRKIFYTVQATFTGVEMHWQVLINGMPQGERNVSIFQEEAPDLGQSRHY